MLSSEGDEPRASLDQVEAALGDVLLGDAVARAKGNLSAAARMLGITCARLVYRLNGRDAGSVASSS